MSTAFRVGSFECRLIADGGGPLPPEVVFENAPARARAAALSGRLDRDGRLPVPYGCLLVHSADALEHPDWVMSFDDEPGLNVETRNALLEHATDEERIVGAAHLRKPGRIERVQGGFRFEPLRSEP